MTMPNGLDAGGRRLWRGVTADHDLVEWQLVLLLEACRARDRLDRLAPVASAGDFKAMREERLTALSMSRLLAALRLPDRSTGRRPQRRGGARGSYAPRGV